MSSLEDSDDEIPEMTVRIETKLDKLDELGIDPLEFEQALDAALDHFFDSIEAAENPDQVPDIDDVIVEVGGQSVRLGDVASIEIGEDDLDDEDEEELDDAHEEHDED